MDLIVKSKLKEAVRESGEELNVASDVAGALNEKVTHLLNEAAQRAKANGRRTLQARDL